MLSLLLLLTSVPCPPASTTASVAAASTSLPRCESPGPQLQPSYSTAGPSALDHLGTPALVTTMAGAAVGASGIMVMLYGATANPGVSEICLSVDSNGCQGRGYWLRFGFKTRETIDLSSSPNGRGPMIFPLGISLITTGLITGLGAVLFGNDEDVPWIPIVAGVAGGALAYGMFALTEGSSNFDK